MISGPPEGRNKWNLRLLTDKLVELEIVPDISHETVRRALKKCVKCMVDDVIHNAAGCSNF